MATASAADRPNYPPSEWLLRERWPFRVIADDEAATAAQAFGTTGYPYLVMLDEAGIVQWRHSGELADGQLEQYLDVVFQINSPRHSMILASDGEHLIVMCEGLELLESIARRIEQNINHCSPGSPSKPDMLAR